jgi:hypothetical protein
MGHLVYDASHPRRPRLVSLADGDKASACRGPQEKVFPTTQLLIEILNLDLKIP